MRLELGLHLDINLHDSAALQRSLKMLQRLPIDHVRLPIRLLDQHRPNADLWYRRVLRALEGYRVLPAIAPPPLPIAPADLVSFCTTDTEREDEPSALRDGLAQFVEQFIARHGEHFDEVQIGDHIDPRQFHVPRTRPLRPDGPFVLTASLLHRAAACAQHHGKRTVLAGLSPICPRFLNRLDQIGGLRHFDVVAVHVPADAPAWADGSPLCSFLHLQRQLGAVVDQPFWITHTAPTPPTCNPVGSCDQENPRHATTCEQYLEDAAYAPFERLYLDARAFLPRPGRRGASGPLRHLQRLAAEKHHLDQHQGHAVAT